MPCLFRKSAVVNPPIPAPTMIAFMLTPSLSHLPLDVFVAEIEPEAATDAFDEHPGQLSKQDTARARFQIYS
jgi:hypothetical protein